MTREASDQDPPSAFDPHKAITRRNPMVTAALAAEEARLEAERRQARSVQGRGPRAPR